jgi:hypothetical protein
MADRQQVKPHGQKQQQEEQTLQQTEYRTGSFS